MECEVYIENELIGKATFKIIDESMVAISEKFSENEKT